MNLPRKLQASDIGRIDVPERRVPVVRDSTAVCQPVIPRRQRQLGGRKRRRGRDRELRAFTRARRNGRQTHADRNESEYDNDGKTTTAHHSSLRKGKSPDKPLIRPRRAAG